MWVSRGLHHQMQVKTCFFRHVEATTANTSCLPKCRMRRSTSTLCCFTSPPTRTAGGVYRNIFHLACHESREDSSHTVQGLVLDPVTVGRIKSVSQAPGRQATADWSPECFNLPDHYSSGFGLSPHYLTAKNKRLTAVER